ncbi:MAG TPA: hypothetical protein DCY75_04810, partial [Clostridiales bacterium]|nr:hypothetical protein [Clostridiales bacterium]
PASDSLIFPTSDTYPMTASETTGKGTFTLHTQNNCFNIGYLLPGYKTLILSSNANISVNATDFPSFGYDTMFIEEGSSLTVNGTLSQSVDLSITSSNNVWKSSSFVVMNVNAATYAKLTLSEESAGLGTLRYDEKTGDVWFDTYYGGITYVIRDSESAATAPENSSLYTVGLTTALAKPNITSLPDGRVFKGWRNRQTGDFYSNGKD